MYNYTSWPVGGYVVLSLSFCFLKIYLILVVWFTNHFNSLSVRTASEDLHNFTKSKLRFQSLCVHRTIAKILFYYCKICHTAFVSLILLAAIQFWKQAFSINAYKTIRYSGCVSTLFDATAQGYFAEE